MINFPNTQLLKILAIIGIIAGAYMYFKYSQGRIEELNREITAYQVASKVANETIDELNENNRKQKILLNKLQVKLKDSEIDNDRLKKLLRKHDLTKLSLKKPGMIEKRINDATKQIFSDITNITTD